MPSRYHGRYGTSQSDNHLVDVQLSCSLRSTKERFDLQLTLTAFFYRDRGDHGRDAAIKESDHGNVRMEGLVLGFLLIPFENLLLRGDSRAENLRIYDAIDFAVRKGSNNARRRRIIAPTTIFDYRAPQICTIDVSNSALNDIQGDWDKIAELCALSV